MGLIGFSYRRQDTSDSRWNRKRARVLGKIRNECPHIRSITPAGGDRFEVQGSFVSPSGVLDFYCVVCGVRWPRPLVGQFLDEYTAMVSDDPAGAIERHRTSLEKTRKLVRKLNRLGGMPS